ncbi:MAG: glycosyltransferase family 39 protein [Planctomycetota bacterium]
MPVWTKRFRLFLAAHVVVWTLVPLLTHGNPPLDVLEGAAWGQNAALGYFKHPPLPAWLTDAAVRVGRALTGSGAWPVYLLSQLFMALTFVAVWRLAHRLLDPPLALLAVVALELSPWYTLVTGEFNHNIAVLAFFALSADAFERAVHRGRRGDWLRLGLWLALGGLSKYVIALLALSMAAHLLLHAPARRHLRTRGPYLALAVALLVCLPHLVWLVRSDFQPVSYALARGKGAPVPWPRLLYPAYFAASQLLFLIPVLFALLPVLGFRWRARAAGEARPLLAAVTFGPFLLMFLLSLATGMRVRTAWGLPFWSTLPLFLLSVFARRPAAAPLSFRLVRLTAPLLVAAAVIVNVWGPHLTGVAIRIHFPGRVLAAEAERIWNARADTPLERVGGDPFLAANVSFHHPDRPPAYAGLPDDHAAHDAWIRARGGLVFWDAGREGAAPPDGLARRFPRAQWLEPLVLPQRTGAAVAPARVGVAFVPPTSGR